MIALGNLIVHMESKIFKVYNFYLYINSKIFFQIVHYDDFPKINNSREHSISLGVNLAKPTCTSLDMGKSQDGNHWVKHYVSTFIPL